MSAFFLPTISGRETSSEKVTCNDRICGVGISNDNWEMAFQRRIALEAYNVNVF